MKLFGFLLINGAFCSAALFYGNRASQRRRWLLAFSDFFRLAADEIKHRQKTRAAVGRMFYTEGHAPPAIKKQLMQAASARGGFAALGGQPSLSLLRFSERGALADADRAFSMPCADQASESLALVATYFSDVWKEADGSEKKRTDAVRSILALCGLLLSVLLL